MWCATHTIIPITYVPQLSQTRSETQSAYMYEYIERAIGSNQGSNEIGQVFEGYFKEFYPREENLIYY